MTAVKEIVINTQTCAAEMDRLSKSVTKIGRTELHYSNKKKKK